jgi:hypothetical protein
MNIVGILRKKIISIKGRWSTFLTNDALKAKDSAARMINKIPAL